jgi:sulfoxide reductase heme-binding subunit YedZ
MTSSTFFWVTSRAAGTTAMVLASATVGFGLTMGGKLLRAAGPERRTIHEILSLSAIAAIAVHGLALIGDTWLHPSVLDVTVPFLAPYNTLYTAIGIIAGWGIVLLGLSFYARRRIGQARWKAIHRFTAVAWLLALVHTFTEGTDAGKLWFIALILLTAAPALVLLVIRHARPERRATLARSPGGETRSPGATVLPGSPAARS